VRRRLLWSIAFGALGFLVDGWPLVVFDELAFRFGGLFYLTATLALGPLWGLLAALLTGARHLTEGDVFPLLLMAGEAWTVGWVVRRGRSPLYADILYWALAGAPLVSPVECSGTESRRAHPHPPRPRQRESPGTGTDVATRWAA